jgi:hypothetical protein
MPRTITLEGGDGGISYTISSGLGVSGGIHELKKIGAKNRKLRTIGDMVHDGIDFNTIDGLFGNTKPHGYTGSTGGDTMVDEYKKSLKPSTDAYETVYPKIKKLTASGSWSPELRIMEATEILCETGLAPSKIAQSPCTTYDNVSQGLDPSSSLPSNRNMMAGDNYFDTITFEESFFQLFQFPIGMRLIITSTRTAEVFNITLTIEEIGDVKGRLTRVWNNDICKWVCTRIPPPPSSINLCEHLQNCSNNNKKDRFGNPGTSNNEKIILLILKELGDFLQVIFYLIWFLSEKTNKEASSVVFNEPSWKKNHAMITTDSVVYNLCKELGLSCVYTGSTAGSGYINLYKYMEVDLTPDDYKDMFNNLKKCHLQEILNYNNSVLFILSKIKLGANNTWAIPFLEGNDIKFIDGSNFMNLTYRSVVTQDNTPVEGNIISNTLKQLVDAYFLQISIYNQALTDEITAIDNGTTPTPQLTSMAEVNYQLGLFIQDQVFLEKRSSIIFTTEIFTDLLTGRNTPARMYFICPYTPLYNDICNIFFPHDQNGTFTVIMGRQPRQLRKIQGIEELKEARKVYMSNSFRGGGSPNVDKFIQLDNGIFFHSPNIICDISVPTGNPSLLDTHAILRQYINTALEWQQPKLDYSKNSDGDYADFDTRNLNYDLRTNLQFTPYMSIKDSDADFNYVYTITCMINDLFTTYNIQNFQATPQSNSIFGFLRPTKPRFINKGKNNDRQATETVKRTERTNALLKQRMGDIKESRTNYFHNKRMESMPTGFAFGGTRYKRKVKRKTQRRSLHKNNKRTLKKNKRPARKTQRRN